MRSESAKGDGGNVEKIQVLRGSKAMNYFRPGGKEGLSRAGAQTVGGGTGRPWIRGLSVGTLSRLRLSE